MNVGVSEVSGKSLALLLYFVNENYDSSAAIIRGIVNIDGSRVWLHRGEGLPPVQVPGKLLAGLRRTPEGYADIFDGAEYFLTLTARDLDGPSREEFFRIPA